MENMYTQAIADAKAVRESAMANAKAAIQEAFEPKIKAMLKKHIVESEKEMDEAEHIVHTKKSARSHAAGFHKSPAPKGAIEDLEEEYEEMEEGHYEDEMEEGYHDEEEMDEAESDTITIEVEDLDPSNLYDKAFLSYLEKNGISRKITQKHHPKTGAASASFTGPKAAIESMLRSKYFDLTDEDIKNYMMSEAEKMDEAEHIVHTSKAKRAGLNGMKHAPAPKGAIEDLEEGSFMLDYNDAEYIQHMLDQAGINAMAKPGIDDEEVEIHGDAKALNKAKRLLQKDGFDLGLDETEMADEAFMEDPGNLDEKYLDEILDELEEMDGEEDEMDEAKELEEAEDMEEAKKDEEEEEEGEEEGEEEEEDGAEGAEEDTKVVDVTLGDLVNAIKAAMAGHEGGEGMEAGAEDEVSLDEILAELEDESEEEEMDEAKKMEEAKKKKMEEKKELEEAKKAIKSMQKELNEINLLNAKLLYVNKIFKSKSLTEAQKVKVLNAFDKATTVKEAKNTYKIISESITAAPKKTLKESYGFASKPSGIVPKTNTLESDPFIARMQKLAGL